MPSTYIQRIRYVSRHSEYSARFVGYSTILSTANHLGPTFLVVQHPDILECSWQGTPPCDSRFAEELESSLRQRRGMGV